MDGNGDMFHDSDRLLQSQDPYAGGRVRNCLQCSQTLLLLHINGRVLGMQTLASPTDRTKACLEMGSVVSS